MGEIGKDFLPEDIFAEVETDTSHAVVRKNDQTTAEMSEDDNEANINQKKGKNFDKKHIGKTSKKLFLLVLLFVFLFVLLFVFINFVINLSSKSNTSKINTINNQTISDSDTNAENPILKDTDADGLIDIEESNFGTDYKVYDTDGDLVSDGEEVKKYRTNPLSPDTDGDGISDYDEIFIYKTNPLSSDTDADGYRDMDEINNGYSPIDSTKMSPEYLKDIEDQKILKDEKQKNLK